MKNFSARVSKGNTKMSCRNIYPMWFTTEAFMALDAKIRFLFIGLMCLADTEGRLLYSIGDIWHRVAYMDFSAPNDIAPALDALAENGLIIIYTVIIDDVETTLIQLVDYNHYQAGNAYKAGASLFPAPNGYTVTPTENELKKLKQKQSAMKADEDESFNTFWNLYPRKGNRAEAVKAWQELAPTVDIYQAIITGLDRWSAYWGTINPQYIPYPAKYINDGMYLLAPPTGKATKDDADATLRAWITDDTDLPF